MLRINGQKAHLPWRLWEEGHSWSAGWLCPVYVLFPDFSHIFYQVWSSSRAWRWSIFLRLRWWLPWVRCGFVTLSCMTAQLFYGLIHAPLAIAVDGLLPMSELLWALTLFLHYHLGMRQLKASGNLGFIDISQRPQPGSICFPWQVSPTSACLPGCCPCTQPVALTAALLWGRHTTFYGNSSPSREMEVDVGSRGEGMHAGVRSGKEGLACS